MIKRRIRRGGESEKMLGREGENRISEEDEKDVVQ
jgi:hypothetical protein